MITLIIVVAATAAWLVCPASFRLWLLPLYVLVGVLLAIGAISVWIRQRWMRLYMNQHWLCPHCGRNSVLNERIAWWESDGAHYDGYRHWCSECQREVEPLPTQAEAVRKRVEDERKGTPWSVTRSRFKKASLVLPVEQPDGTWLVCEEKSWFRFYLNAESGSYRIENDRGESRSFPGLKELFGELERERNSAPQQ